ncbi:unnamed protein product [Leptidea sinapis]|uniref:Endonuclease/exonuclease/phosphatase domain-containing protein n=1 Tax=Leptidea sinapis TaxID=189913 RepID=A0A5E4QUR2_9NEOP|nr:unnamed protein product [Leptidea sinapis]
MNSKPTNITLATFNCRSIKRSAEQIKKLSENVDILALQETWLLPHDLGFVNGLSQHFSCIAKLAVDTSTGILKSRPLAAVQIDLGGRHILVMTVYLPFDDGNEDCLADFIACLGSIEAVISDSDIEAIMGWLMLFSYIRVMRLLGYKSVLTIKSSDILHGDLGVAPHGRHDGVQRLAPQPPRGHAQVAAVRTEGEGALVHVQHDQQPVGHQELLVGPQQRGWAIRRRRIIMSFRKRDRSAHQMLLTTHSISAHGYQIVWSIRRVTSSSDGKARVEERRVAAMYKAAGSPPRRVAYDDKSGK